jgi:hypothetical protein
MSVLKWKEFPDFKFDERLRMAMYGKARMLRSGVE